MDMDASTLASALTPLLADQDLDLYDLELSKQILRVYVSSTSGVTLEQLATANQTISLYLDEHDPFTSRYTLEVTSPGVERRLRTQTHFAGAIGEAVRLKTTPEQGAERRVEGELLSADESGISVRAKDDTVVTLSYDQIEKARTHFEWGSTAKPSPSRGGSPRGKRRAPQHVRERIITP